MLLEIPNIVQGVNLTDKNYCMVIGGANMDILGQPMGKLSQMSSSPGSVSYSAGGVARNIAENLARLGNSCYLIAPVGKDVHGKRLIKESAAVGVITETMVEVSNFSTSSYLSIVDATGEMQLAISDMDIFQHFSMDEIRPHLPIINQADIVVLDTNLSEQLLRDLFLEVLDKTVFVDTISIAKAEKIRPYLRFVHTLKPNLQEAEVIAGIKVKDEEQDLPKLGRWFIEQGVKRLFISMGSRGLYYCDCEEQRHFSLPVDRVVNSNGAGDALTAGLAHCWLHGKNQRDTCMFALASAKLALSATTTIHPDMSVKSVYSELK